MIRVVLVDDEESALDMLNILFMKIGNISIIGMYTNPRDALEEIEISRPDAVFIDIDMPGMTGMEMAKAIGGCSPETRIVFTTAYSEYAVEAFSIGSTDYLLKPMTIERLRMSVERIKKVADGGLRLQNQPMITCMGSFSVPSTAAQDGRMSWRTKKEKELCAFLCHHTGKVVDRDVIMETLWPESDIERTRAYLYSCVSFLRRDLRKYGVTSVSANRTGDGYSLYLDGITCDWIELQTCLDEAIAADEMDVRLLYRITALYLDDYMKDCDYDWALRRREELAGKYVRVLRRFAKFCRAKKDIATSIDCLQHVLKVSPDSEMDGRTLMNLYMEAGNRTEAIRVYRQLVQTVQINLDLDLEEATMLLYERIVSTET